MKLKSSQIICELFYFRFPRSAFLFFSYYFRHFLSNIRRRTNHIYSQFTHYLHFGCSCIISSADNSTRMTHTAAGRSGLTGNEGSDWLRDAGYDVTVKSTSMICSSPVSIWPSAAASPLAPRPTSVLFRVVKGTFWSPTGGKLAFHAIFARDDRTRGEHGREGGMNERSGGGDLPAVTRVGQSLRFQFWL